MRNWATFVFVICIFCVNQKNSFCKTVKTIELDDNCISCICVAISDCNKSLKCNADVCGMFRITEPYWIDGGSPELPGKIYSTLTDAYRDCTNDEKCATKTVKKYLTDHGHQDCNDDGIIDCFDYGAVHKYGGFGGCQENCLKDSTSYFNKLDTCLKNGPSQILAC